MSLVIKTNPHSLLPSIYVFRTLHFVSKYFCKNNKKHENMHVFKLPRPPISPPPQVSIAIQLTFFSF